MKGYKHIGSYAAVVNNKPLNDCAAYEVWQKDSDGTYHVKREGYDYFLTKSEGYKTLKRPQEIAIQYAQDAADAWGKREADALIRKDVEGIKRQIEREDLANQDRPPLPSIVWEGLHVFSYRRYMKEFQRRVIGPIVSTGQDDHCAKLIFRKLSEFYSDDLMYVSGERLMPYKFNVQNAQDAVRDHVVETRLPRPDILWFTK